MKDAWDGLPYYHCECCGMRLAHPVWLVFRTSTSTYHTPEEAEAQGWIGTDDDQGAFPFGRWCALNETGRVRAR